MEQGFQFGLERVRELREHAESQAKEQLAASLGQRLRGAAMLARASDDLASATAGRPELSGAPASGADLLAHERWLAALAQDREHAALQLDRLDAEVRDRREALGDASRRREILERLKERRRAEHRTAAARREGAELDEIAISAHVRKGRGRTR